MEPQKNNANVSPNVNKIHVTGFPSYTQAQDLTKVFSEYGKVTLDKLTRKFATLTFVKDEDAKAALRDSTRVNIYGKFLVVQRHQKHLDEVHTLPNKENPLTQKRDEIVSPFRIDLSGEFLQQVDNLMATVRLTLEEVNRLAMLYADLEHVLQELWPGCKAVPFGSIVTGLGIKSSDADCYIELPHALRHPNEKHVAKAKRALLAHPQIFTEIVPIPRANTPIVKFYHLPTETNCDVTFKTPLGTQNSKLIAFLLQADPRFIPLAVIIKYWAKVHCLSGTRKLTNYALVMMIIFYLQQHPISILPSIHWLQRNPSDEYTIDYWNAGFMGHHDRLPRSSNTSSLLELLGGFFQYYAEFDFDGAAVCPYIGRPLKKELFADAAALPAEFGRYKWNVEKNHTPPIKFTTPMCVQDPVEQSHNVASAVSHSLASDVREFLRFAAHAYEQDKHSGCKSFLKTILLQKPKLVRLKTASQYKIQLTMSDVPNAMDPNWRAVMRNIVVAVFEDMLKITLYKVEEEYVEPQKEKVCFVGTVTRAVWKRKQFSRVYNVSEMDFADRQSKITDDIARVEKMAFELKFQLAATFYDRPKVGLALKSLGGEPELFREFGKFFKGVVPGWLRMLLRPHLAAAAGAPGDGVETVRIVDNDVDSGSGGSDDDDSTS